MAQKKSVRAQRGFDQQITALLRFGGLDRSNLQELVKVISKLNAAGIRPGRVFPKGIPAPDGVWVHALVTPARLSALTTFLAGQGRIDVVRLFPKGIPVPDVFVAEIGFR